MDITRLAENIFQISELVNFPYICSVMKIPQLKFLNINYKEYTVNDNQLIQQITTSNRPLQIYRMINKKITVQILPKGVVRLSVNMTHNELTKEELINKINKLLIISIENTIKLSNEIPNNENIIELVNNLCNIKFTSINGYVTYNNILIAVSGNTINEFNEFKKYKKSLYKKSLYKKSLCKKIEI